MCSVATDLQLVSLTGKLRVAVQESSQTAHGALVPETAPTVPNHVNRLGGEASLANWA